MKVTINGNAFFQTHGLYLSYYNAQQNSLDIFSFLVRILKTHYLSWLHLIIIHGFLLDHPPPKNIKLNLWEFLARRGQQITYNSVGSSEGLIYNLLIRKFTKA